MSTVLAVLAWLLAIVVAIPLTVFVIELAVGMWRTSRTVTPPPRKGSVAILIPAHDEEDGIGATLETLGAVAPKDTRVVVVADNCSDATASVARDAGAEVIERHDTQRRGKGYALAFGRDFLAEGETPDVVIVLDADCRLLPGTVEILTGRVLDTDRPVQAVNLVSPDLSASPMTQIAGFAMMVKNLFRSRGMQRLGGAALLTGTGMTFPWRLLADAELATGSIVEDLALGIALTKSGHTPLLSTDAHVRSDPPADGDALQQRKRWEHGFLDSLKSEALPTFAGGLRSLSLRQVLLGLHLMVPPLALLLMLAGLVWVTTVVLAVLGGPGAPSLLLGGLIAVAAILVLIAWLARGREFLSAKALLMVPFYALWKIPIYIGFFRKQEANWTRTPRR